MYNIRKPIFNNIICWESIVFKYITYFSGDIRTSKHMLKMRIYSVTLLCIHFCTFAIYTPSWLISNYLYGWGRCHAEEIILWYDSISDRCQWMFVCAVTKLFNQYESGYGTVTLENSVPAFIDSEFLFGSRFRIQLQRRTSQRMQKSWWVYSTFFTFTPFPHHDYILYVPRMSLCTWFITQFRVYTCIYTLPNVNAPLKFGEVLPRYPTR